MEQLVEALYRVEAAGQGAGVVIDKIECPGHVEDKETGSSREFDVLVSGALGKMPFQLAIECKDWERAVDAPVVEGFISKCSGTNVPLRMIVSASGFGDPALKKAAAHGIQCRTLEEVGNPDWLATNEFTHTERRMTNVSLLCDVGREVPERLWAGVVDREGKEVTAAMQQQVGLAVLGQIDPLELQEGKQVAKLGISELGWNAVLTDGSQLPVSVVVATVDFEVIRQRVPVMSFLEQVHIDGAAPIAHAVAHFPEGRLIISENPDGTKGVTFVPASRL